MSRLELPEQALLERELVVLVLEVHQMQAPLLPIERLYRRDDTLPISNDREHAHAGQAADLPLLLLSAPAAVLGQAAAVLQRVRRRDAELGAGG